MNRLNAIRQEFQTFYQQLITEIGVSNEELDKLGFVEFGKLIFDDEKRTKFIELVVCLMNENIRSCQSDDSLEYTVDWAQTILDWCRVKDGISKI